MSGLVIGKCYGVDVTHPQQTVLIALADHAEDDGTAVFPSIAYVAWKTGYSDRQITRLIGDLQRLGVLVLVKKAYRGRANEYRIDLTNAPMKKPFRSESSINTDDTQMSPQIPVVSPEAIEITGDISDHTGDILTLWGDKTDITDDTQMSPRTVLLTANTEPSLKPSGIAPVAIASRRPSAKEQDEKLSADGRRQSVAARELRESVLAEHVGLSKQQAIRLNQNAPALVLAYPVEDILGCWRAIKAKFDGDYRDISWVNTSMQSWLKAGRPSVEPARSGANNDRRTNGLQPIDQSAQGTNKYREARILEDAIAERSRSQRRPVSA